MYLITELSMPLGPKEYKRLVSGEECRIEAKKAIKDLLERTMNVALTEKIATTKRTIKGQRDRRNGYYERSLLTAFGYIEHIQVPRGRATSLADVVLPK